MDTQQSTTSWLALVAHAMTIPTLLAALPLTALVLTADVEVPVFDPVPLSLSLVPEGDLPHDEGGSEE